jgi:uncharacterized protein YdiU (UPF0061 family)
METIMFKAPKGTKAKLKRINPNLSALMREAAEKVIQAAGTGSAFEKAERLCGIIKEGPADASTSKDYLRRYAPKSAH